MMIMLQMNHRFLQYMGSKYSAPTHYQFGFTFVDLVEDGSDSEQWEIGLPLY